MGQIGQPAIQLWVQLWLQGKIVAWAKLFCRTWLNSTNREARSKQMQAVRSAGGIWLQTIQMLGYPQQAHHALGILQPAVQSHSNQCIQWKWLDFNLLVFISGQGSQKKVLGQVDSH